MPTKRGAYPAAGLLLTAITMLLVSSLHPSNTHGAALLRQDNALMPPHQAHLHQGTCATGGELIVQLADVTLVPNHPTGTPAPDAMAVLPAAIPVTQSTTIIPMALADLLAEPVTIEVHESILEPADVIACGDLGGTSSGAELVIGLAPIEPRGAPGVARLRSDGETTEVTIFIVEGLSSPNAAPAGSDASDASAETVTVTLGGPAGEFTISASQTTFRVGIPYHFEVTNLGVIPHEFLVLPTGLGGGDSTDQEQIHHVALATIDDEDLPSGATGAVDVTFMEAAPAGTLEFLCALAGHYESGMHLPIEVVS